MILQCIERIKLLRILAAIQPVRWLQWYKLLTARLKAPSISNSGLINTNQFSMVLNVDSVSYLRQTEAAGASVHLTALTGRPTGYCGGDWSVELVVMHAVTVLHGVLWLVEINARGVTGAWPCAFDAGATLHWSVSSSSWMYAYNNASHDSTPHTATRRRPFHNDSCIHIHAPSFSCYQV